MRIFLGIVVKYLQSLAGSSRRANANRQAISLYLFYRANHQIAFLILLEIIFMANEAEIVANDLKIYFSGLEVALHQGKVDDAIRYIGNIKSELDDNLSYLQSKRGGQEKPEGSPAGFQEAA